MSGYANGHTLSVDDNKRTYTSYTYIDSVEMQEQVVTQNDAITAILINTFDYAGKGSAWGPVHPPRSRMPLFERPVAAEGAVATGTRTAL